ncbi:MAG: C-GCAxxG-C-C family protein [Clostridia bacterium]|nr:C-GCAxxG-C-C family protein [Clostridia bacterium]MDR3645604.1 C-GCAxxG-C-C family protein [Clostridia bacterium]
MDRKQTALNSMDQNFNCAQSVFSAFAEDVGVDRQTALKTAACFGGGMRCGEVCGAVTGALMAIGVKFGSCTENDKAGKLLAYERSTEFIRRFREKEGSLLCRELLGVDPSKPEEMQKAMQNGLHITVCAKAVADAVEIAEEII